MTLLFPTSGYKLYLWWKAGCISETSVKLPIITRLHVRAELTQSAFAS
jgi:hypothetical protein